jgi:arsenate reductase-like glutaredoxin family protein
VKIAEVIDAKKQRYPRNDALALLKGVKTLHVAKGKKVTSVDLAKDRPDDDELAGLLLGPSGNLRAPTQRVGKAMYVGFNAEMYEDLLG